MDKCGISKVDQMGQLLPTQSSVDFSQYLEVPCFTSLPRDDLTPLEFRIEKSDMNVDLSSIHLYLVLETKNADGKDIERAKQLAAFINQVAYSMFSSVNLYINNQRVTLNQSNYPFMMYTLNFLLTTKDEKKFKLYSAGWADDDPSLFDLCPYMKAKDKTWVAEDYVNQGFKDRKDFVNSNGFPFYAHLVFDSILLPRVLPNQTDVSIVLNRADPSFFIQAKSGAFSVSVTDAKLYALRMKLSDQALTYQNHLLTSGGISYPAVRYDVRTTTLISGSQNLDWTPFSGQMPQRIFFFQCLQSSYNGKLDKNPFYLQHFNIKSFQTLINGRSVPWNQPLSVNPGNRLKGFLYTTMNCLQDVPPIEYTDYIGGYFFVVVDLSRTFSAPCDYNDETQNGNLRLIVNYRDALSESIIVFCMAEFRSTLHIDANRNPTWI